MLEKNAEKVQVVVCFTGLLDAKDEEDFTTKLANLQHKWNTLERKHLSSGSEPHFYEYISSKVS